MKPLVDTSKDDAKIKKADRKRERELSDIRFILKSPEGRRLYWRIMEKGGVFRDGYAGTDTNGTNYNLGRQSISRDFLNDLLEADSKILTQMQDERKAEAEDERRQQKIEDDANTLI